MAAALLSLESLDQQFSRSQRNPVDRHVAPIISTPDGQMKHFWRKNNS
jgi:hypothetical protein